MDLLHSSALQLIVTIVAALFIAAIGWAWKIPQTLTKISLTLESLEQLAKHSMERIGRLELRQRVIDRFVSDMSGLSVDSDAIAQGHDHYPDNLCPQCPVRSGKIKAVP